MAAKKDDADELYKIPERVSANAHIKGMHNYLTTWEASVEKTELVPMTDAVRRGCRRTT